MVGTSESPSLEAIEAGKIAVEVVRRMLGGRVEHIEGRRTSVEEIRSLGRTYHEPVNLDVMDAWTLMVLSATDGKPQWRDTSVVSLPDGLPLSPNR